MSEPVSDGESAEIGARWRAVRVRVDEAARRAGRGPETVTLLAVSKTFPAEAVEAAWAAGARDFGENYAQELAQKTARAKVPGARWHFIGHLQRNKVKLVVPAAAVVQTVDSERLLAAIAERVAPGARQDVLLEVNVGGEASKSGVAPDDLASLLDRALGEPRVRVTGLMTIPPLAEDPETTRPQFAALRALRDREAARTGAALADLSMGMSADYEVAIAEGATVVRVGSAIFGTRSARASA